MNGPLFGSAMYLDGGGVWPYIPEPASPSMTFGSVGVRRLGRNSGRLNVARAEHHAVHGGERRCVERAMRRRQDDHICTIDLLSRSLSGGWH